MARKPKVTKKRQDRRPKSSATSGSGRPHRGRPKVCLFCAEHATWVDYKDVFLLRRFVNDRGRIKARGATGTCGQHQRDVAVAIKTARELALLPYAVRTAATEGRGGRGGDRRGNGALPTAAAAPGDEASGPGPGAEIDEGEGDGPDPVADDSVAAQA